MSKQKTLRREAARKLVSVIECGMTRKGMSEAEKKCRWDRFADLVDSVKGKK